MLLVKMLVGFAVGYVLAAEWVESSAQRTMVCIDLHSTGCDVAMDGSLTCTPVFTCWSE